MSHDKKYLAYEKCIEDTVKAVLINKAVYIEIQVLILTNNGGILSAALNSSVLAIIHCGIAISDTPVSLSIGMYKEEFIVDPSAEEVEACTVLVTCTNLYLNKKLASLHIEKRTDAKRLNEIITLTKSLCETEIYPLMRECILTSCSLKSQFAL